MTVATSGREAVSLTNGVTRAFPVLFKVLLSSDLVVSLETIATGAAVALTEGVDYTITGSIVAGAATVTTTAAYPVGYRLRRRRETARVQPLNLVPNDGAPAAAQEDAYDRAIVIAQEQDDDVDDVDRRALTVPKGETAGVLAPLSARIGGGKKVLAIDQATGAFQVEPIGEAYRGNTGPANSTYASLADLRAAPASNLSYILTTPSGPITYAYVAGDFTGRADDRYIVELDAVPLSQGALIRDSSVVSIRDFGAKGDFIADDTDAIQAAIDFIAEQPDGGVVTVPPGVFRLVYRASPDGIGVVCLVLKDKVMLQGSSKFGSILKLGNLAIGPGTFGRIIASDHTFRIQSCGIQNLLIDGNKDGQGLFARQGNGGNIVIGNCENIDIQNIVSINANGQCIQVVGSRERPIENLSIHHCSVANAAGSSVNADGSIDLEFNGNGIGIQVTYAFRYESSHNTVAFCKDNGIDTYNENVDYSVVPPVVYTAVGGAGIISDNRIHACRVGLFPETSQKLKIIDNYVSLCVEAGLALNRINSPPLGMEVTGNTFDANPIGVRVSGDGNDLPGNIITDNFFIGAIPSNGAAILLDKTSHLLIRGNTFGTDNPAAAVIRLQGSSVSFVRITGNAYFGNPNPGTLVYNLADAIFSVIDDDWISCEGTSYDRADNAFKRFNAQFTNASIRNLIFNGTAITAVAPAAGGGGALPATPTGYVTVNIGGVDRLLPYY